MSEELFDVCFYGILQPGRDKDTVMANMARLFKTDAAKLTPYFAGGRKVIKAGVNADVAEKYRGALENVGLIIKIEPGTAAASPEKPAAPAQTDSSTASSQETEDKQSEAPIDTGGITVAPVGADVIENPVEPEPALIGDISNISMAEPGADVLENPVRPPPVQIDDISDITMAEPGADVLVNPPETPPAPVGDISDLSLAEPGADIIENPPPKEKAPVPDTSELSLD